MSVFQSQVICSSSQVRCSSSSINPLANGKKLCRVYIKMVQFRGLLLVVYYKYLQVVIFCPCKNFFVIVVLTTLEIIINLILFLIVISKDIKLYANIFQPSGFTTHWLFSLELELMCSGVTCPRTAMIRRTCTGTRTQWQRHEPFRPWSGHWERQMNCPLNTGTSTLAAWCCVFKVGHTPVKHNTGVQLCSLTYWTKVKTDTAVAGHE